MSGVLIHSAPNVNADTAGVTGGGVSTPSVAPLSPTEYFSNMVHTDMGGLGHLFGHGVFHAVATPLEHATDSVFTELGGMAHLPHVLSPHVGGRTADGVQVESFQPRFVDTVRGELSKFRSRLGL
jgi:hypothetical protein